MTSTIQQRHINKIQAIIFMQRLYAHLLLLRYVQLLAKSETLSPLAGEGRVRGKMGKPLKTETTRYFYDNENILFEYDERGNIGNRYVHGQGIDEPLAIERKGEVYYYHAAGLGSITALTDKKQKSVESYTYDSFGEVKRKGDKVKNTFTYTGREWDRETGLYYYRARYYDAKVGRFISFDPILRGFSHTEATTCNQSISGFPLIEPQKLHPFAYTGSNPVNLTDPFGLFTYNKPEPQTGKLSGEALNLANCMEGCIGKTFVVSGGSECTGDQHVPGGAKGSKHCTNQAFDMWPTGMDKTKVYCCAKKCGAKYILNEGTHWHFQTTTGLNGRSGELPKDCECK